MRFAKYIGFIGAFALLSLLAAAAPVQAKEHHGGKEISQEEKKQDKEAEKNQKKQLHEAQKEERRVVHEKNLEALHEKNIQRRQYLQEYQYQRKQARETERDADRQRQLDVKLKQETVRAGEQQQRLDLRLKRQELSKQRQQELAAREIERRREFVILQREKERALDLRVAELRRENRIEQARIQQAYLSRLAEQRTAFRTVDFYSNPVYYFQPAYRFQRNGTYYPVSQYGASVLEDAVNYGCQAGYDAGRADRRDGWPASYSAALAYQEASYGYPGYVVSRGDYNYYFRQGFKRCYEDGYYSRYRYGQFSNGNMNILGTILEQILNLRPMY